MDTTKAPHWDFHGGSLHCHQIMSPQPRKSTSSGEDLQVSWRKEIHVFLQKSISLSTYHYERFLFRIQRISGSPWRSDLPKQSSRAPLRNIVRTQRSPQPNSFASSGKILSGDLYKITPFLLKPWKGFTRDDFKELAPGQALYSSASFQASEIEQIVGPHFLNIPRGLPMSFGPETEIADAE